MLSVIDKVVAIVAAVLGLIFLGLGIYEVCFCIQYMQVIGMESMSTYDTMSYIVDQCAPMFGFGTIHLVAAYIIVKIGG